MPVVRLRVKIGSTMTNELRRVACFSALEIDILKIELDLTHDSRVNTTGLDKMKQLIPKCS